ncbi:MAG TPA: choice-of-anchor Q domain-containing protein, partial [Pirellulales bacterium]|nr:choice-of-anchor Q domain-containing protein [Pirellulales bacterium]
MSIHGPSKRALCPAAPTFRGGRRKAPRLTLEFLESRRLLSGGAPAAEYGRLPMSFEPIVNTSADTHAADASASPDDANGNVSLRSAVEYLNATQQAGYTIEFDMTKVASPIELSLGPIEIAESMTVQGPGASALAIGQITTGVARLFQIDAADAKNNPVAATISALTLNAGLVGPSNAAAIENVGKLTAAGTNFDATLGYAPLVGSQVTLISGGGALAGPVEVNGVAINQGDDAFLHDYGDLYAFQADYSAAGLVLAFDPSPTIHVASYGSTTSNTVTIGPSTPPPPGAVVADWRFEEGAAGQPATGSNTVIDSSANALNGTAINGPVYSANVPLSGLPQTGQADKLSMQFNGGNQRVFIPDNPLFQLTHSLTIEAFIYVTAAPVPSTQDILFRGDNRVGFDPYRLAVDNFGSGPQVAFAIDDAQNNQAALLAPLPGFNQWVHVAGTLDDGTGTMRLYIDGVERASTATSIRPFGPLNAADVPGLGIGSTEWTDNEYFHGLIDEVRLSNVALSPDQLIGATPANTVVTVNGAPVLDEQAAELTQISVVAGSTNDTFDVAPSPYAQISVDTDNPNGVQGDLLVFDAQSLSVAATPTSFTAQAMQPVDFRGFDHVSLTDVNGITFSTAGDFASDVTVYGGGPTNIYQLGNGTLVAFPTTTWLDYVGGSAADQLRIQEGPNGGLPQFAGNAAAHPNAALGASGLVPQTNGINFDADAGGNLVFDFTQPHDAAYFDDNLSAGQPGHSGVVNVAGAFTLSFTGVTSMLLNGAGGNLTADDAADPAATRLTAADSGSSTDGVSQIVGNGGFQNLRFDGYNGLALRGDNANGNSLTLADVDTTPVAGNGLSGVTLQGGSGPDTFNVVPSAAAAVTVHGGLPNPPTSPGDTLVVPWGATLSDTFDPNTGDYGTWTVSGYQRVAFDGIETLRPDLIVNTSADTDAASRSTSPLDPNGNISLRSAVEYVNAAQQAGYSIAFDMTKVANPIDLTLGQIEIAESMTIAGPGAGLLSVDQTTSGGARLFQVDAADPNHNGIVATISGLTLSGGSAGGTAGPGIVPQDAGGAIENSGGLTLDGLLVANSSATYGGGIYSDSALSVTNSTLSGNTAWEGGGICNNGASSNAGTVSVGGSLFSNNAATAYGGAVYTQFGPVSVSDSTFSGNSSQNYGGALYISQATAAVSNSTLSSNFTSPQGDGGAIYNDNGATLAVTACTLTANSGYFTGGGIYNSGTLTVTASTLSANSAGHAGGGAIRNLGSLGLTNSTLSGNTAGGDGGGIDNGGTVTVTSSTLSGNSAAGVGGGIASSGTVVKANIANTIVAGNTAANVASDPDVSGDYGNTDHNLIGLVGDATGFTDSSGAAINANILGTATAIDPKLGPLASNGGPTQTMALLPGSPAIDAGGNSPPAPFSAPAADQRGVVRITASDPTIDIGAFELLQAAGGAVALSATEGAALTGTTVATFAAPGPAAAAGDFSATIEWGDGSTTAGSVSGTAATGFTVVGTHTYAEESGSLALTVVVQGDGETAEIHGSAYVADAALSATGGFTMTAAEDATVSGAVAAFTDADAGGTAGDYTATIAWGDGTTSSGTITTVAGGGFAVIGAHAFAEEATPSITVTISDAGGSSGTVTSMANIADAPLGGTGLTVAGTEGVTLGGTLATFTDADPGGTAGDYTATVAWGDGATTAGTISATAGGGFAVIGAHAFAEEATTSITVTISDAGGSSVSVTSTASIGDASLSGTSLTITPTAGAKFSGTVATFTDADPAGAIADYTATIDWGDGTTAAGTITTAAGGGFAVSGAHAYADQGANSIIVAIHDAGGSVTSVTSVANVVAGSAILIVNTSADTHAADASSSPDDANGNVSLRSAIEYLNATLRPNLTIGFDMTKVTSPIELTFGEIEIDESMSIQGPGPSMLTIDQTTGGGARLFQVDSANTDGAAVVAAMSGLTLTGGTANGSSEAAQSGGAIENKGSLTLDAMLLTGNSAAYAGGAINNDATLAVTNCTLSGNSAKYDGGGIFNFAGLSVANSTLAGNSAYLGAAICSVGAVTTLTVTDSTLSGNVTSSYGSGGAIFNSYGATTVISSTLAGNFGDNSGGGIYNDATLTVLDSTIAGNTTSSHGAGGGIYNTKAGAASVVNTIVAVNASAWDPDVYGGGYTTTDHDLIGIVGDATGFTASGATIHGDQVGTTVAIDPRLGSLGNNGGPTQTMALLPGSPAIDTGDDSPPAPFTPPATDQRGIVRITASDPTIDIGAFELLELAGGAATLSAIEGAALSAIVGTFAAPGPSAAPADFSATIQWGDGSTTTGSVSGTAAAGFTVTGTHTYGEETSSLPLTVLVQGDSAAAFIQGAAHIADAPLSAMPTNILATEGAAFNGPVATFTDADPAGAVGDYTATIAWGDGATSTGTITQMAGGGFAVSGAHAYAEESTGSISVTIRDTGGSAATVTSTANVADATLTGSGAPIETTEGATFNGPVAMFTDADPAGVVGDYTATIAWGDGSTSAGTITQVPGGGFAVSGAHAYAEESTGSITVTIRDTGGSAATVTSTANVADATLTGSGAPIETADGATFNGQVTTFTDADPAGAVGDYTATIAWGDGSTSAGTITQVAGGGFAVSGAHAYAVELKGSITVTIRDTGGSAVTVTSTASVADVALAGSGMPIETTEGAAFSGPVAMFTDADPAGAVGDYTATIAWGDGGTSAGTITQVAGGSFAVSGAHAYAEESTGSITVTIRDTGGSAATVTSTANVA